MSKKQSDSNIDDIIETTFSHIKDIVDANTVVGTMIEMGKDMYIVPVSKISVGLISGGGSLPKSKHNEVAAGSGTGFNIIPIGFVTISKGVFGFLKVNQENIEKNILDIAMKFYEIFANKKVDESDEKI